MVTERFERIHSKIWSYLTELSLQYTFAIEALQMSGEHYKNWNTLSVIPARLNAARIAKNLSLRAVAEVLKCNKSQMSRWEQGKQIPSDVRIRMLVELLGTNDFVIPNARNKNLGKALLGGTGNEIQSGS